MELLYKYRDLQNFRFVVDILLKSRLYAAQYFDMNDPMEGHYLYRGSSELDQDIKRRLAGEKKKVRIVSLSRDPANELMWAHYANGHRGVAFGVEPIVDPTTEVRPVEYDGPARLGRESLSSMNAIEILSHKLEVWQYEQEERLFVSGPLYAHVHVRELILGRKMSKQDIGFMRDLAERITPEIDIRNAADVFRERRAS